MSEYKKTLEDLKVVGDSYFSPYEYTVVVRCKAIKRRVKRVTTDKVTGEKFIEIEDFKKDEAQELTLKQLKDLLAVA